jgi:hypothetical protein
MYESTSPPIALDIRDPRHLPPSWAETLGVTPSLVAAKKKLWTQVVNPYCMTCHRTNDMDWSDYATFQYLALDLDGKPYIDYYLADVDEHDPGVPFMPQAKLLFEELQSDSSVRQAIDGWIAALGAPACEAGTGCTPLEICRQGEISSCEPGKVVCEPTQALPDGTPCGIDQACVKGVCTPTLTVDIPTIPTRVYVRTERPGDPEAHVHLSVGGGALFVRQIDLGVMYSDASSEHRLSCSASTLTCKDSETGDSWEVIGSGRLERKNPTRPEVEGTYRIESPVSIPSCAF